MATGRTDLIGFDYGAHLSVKQGTSLPNFDTFLGAKSGSSLVSMLGATDVNALMAKASGQQVQQLVAKFSTDPAFSSYLSGKTTPTLPSQGSAAYNSVLNETGLTNLSPTEYSSYIQTKTVAQQSLLKTGLDQAYASASYKLGSAASGSSNASTTTPMVLVGTTPGQSIVGGTANDVFIPNSTNQTFNGGAGLNTALFSDSKSGIKISKNVDSWSIQGSTVSVTLNQVQRVQLSDTSIALDVSANLPAGKTALLLGAVFGKSSVSNAAFVGIGIGLLDKGMDSVSLAALALNAAGLTTSDQIVNKLWQNVVGSVPTAADKAPYLAMLQNGTSPGELAQLAAQTSINQTNINLTGLSQTGIEFTPTTNT